MIERPALQMGTRRPLVSWIGLVGLLTRRPPVVGGTVRMFSLRAHLFAVVLAAMLPALIVVVLIGASANREADRVHDERSLEIARTLASAVDQEMEMVQAALSVLAATRDLETDDGLTLFAKRAQLIEDETGLRVTLRRPHERVLSDLSPSVLAQDNRSVPSLLSDEVFGDGLLRISHVFIDPNSHLPVAVMVMPALGDGQVLATVETVISADRLTAALRRQSRRAGGLAAVLDQDGRVAGASRDLARLAGQFWSDGPRTETSLIWRGVQRVMGGGATLRPHRVDLASTPGWQVIYREDQPGEGPGSNHALFDSVAAAVAAAGLSLALAALLGSRLTGPLRELTVQARTVTIGGTRNAAPVPSSSVAEFEALRQGMVRADAVLRRRGAAERMALREARTGHELLVSVVNGTAESIYVKDLDLRYVLVNRAALMSGPVLRAEWQVLGRGTSDLFPPIVANRIEAADRAVLTTGRPTTFEQEYHPTSTQDISAEGLPARWLSMTIAPWQDAEGRVVGVVSVSRDITQQRAADHRMRAMQADLLRATRLSAMGAMASGLAHELNQPLAAATNYLNAGGRMLDRGAQGDTQAYRAARGAVSDAAQQMLRAGAIVRRLRDFVERGEAELQPEDVGDVLRQACDLARNDGVTVGIELRVGAVDAGVALIDRTQIQQVLLNLIRNAAEAIGHHISEAGPLATSPGVVIVSADKAPDGGMLIDVSDNGPGLSPDIAERLFQPFVSTKVTGMGIGLAICRTIIEGHGGKLTATANEDRGMLFRIALPALHLAGESS